MRYNTSQTAINFKNENFIDKNKITYGEFFAGGLGCASAAKKHPKVDVRWVLNHDKVAIKTASFHLPDTKVYWADIYMQDEHEIESVDIIQASFECDYHSTAIGAKPIDKQSYMMGWELYRYVKFLQPLILMVENVPGVKKWAPLDENNKPIKERAGEEFQKWKKALMDLGYKYVESIRCAADDGIGTTRTRYFAIFYRDGLDCSFPDFTHNEFGTDGKLPWIPCKNYIDLNNTGHSIFGREFNEDLPKHLRKPYTHNTLRRMGGGIKKYVPDFNNFISTCNFENETSSQTNKKVLVEKIQFIADHCQVDFWQTPDEPLKPILTWQTKQLVTVEQFVAQYYGTDQQQSINRPLHTIGCVDGHQLVTVEKRQFIAQYYNSNGNSGANVHSIEKPLTPILAEPKHQLVTVLEGFDIKARFLNSEELAEISSFPRDFFNRKGFKVSHKDAVKMIGNAVPPEWFYKILSHNIETVIEHKQTLKSA